MPRRSAPLSTRRRKLAASRGRDLRRQWRCLSARRILLNATRIIHHTCRRLRFTADTSRPPRKQSLPELPWRYLLVQDSLRHPKSTISRTITVSWLQRHLPACSAFWTAGMFLCTNFDTAFEIPAEPAGHTARPHGDVTQAQHCVDVESRQLF